MSLTIILIVLLGSKLIILAVTGTVLYKVLWPQFRIPGPTYPMPGVACTYCKATPAVFHSEEQRWEENDLVLVRTYECRECHMPFWQVERVRAVTHNPK